MQEIKKRFSEWRQKLTPKKIAIFVLTLLLLITPTVLAGIYAYYVDYVIQADSYTVTLYDAENREIAHDSGDPELANVNSLVRIFHSVTTDMKQVSKAPGDPESDPFIWADVELNGVKSKLKCFFSFVDTANYCIDQSGKIYTVRASDATNFLSSPYAEAFYREAVAPSLITTDNDVILPSSLSWYYKNYDGEYLPSQRNTVNGAMRIYEVAEAIDIRFDKEPDRCLVQIYEEGVSIYDGSLDGLSALTVNVGSELNVSLTATWDTKVSSLSYGELSYQFGIRIRNQTVFSINTATVKEGGFAILTCTNVTDPSKILFTPDKEYPAPSFHAYGDKLCALLPIPATTDWETLSFRVTYGASTQNFTLTISPSTPQNYTDFSLDLRNNEGHSDAAKAEWNTLLHSLISNAPTPIYFRGKFLSPTENGFSISYHNGGKVFWGHSYDNPYVAVGTEFVTDQDTDAPVRAVNHGVVLQTGTCALLGNYAVIDHGGGLRTWYGHLSTVNVTAGNAVAKGEVIGQTGTGGVSTGNGFLLVCTVYDTVIDPEAILGKELIS